MNPLKHDLELSLLLVINDEGETILGFRTPRSALWAIREWSTSQGVQIDHLKKRLK